MGKKRKIKPRAGRPRQTGRDRYANGRAKAVQPDKDMGTKELSSRRDKLTKSKEYPANPIGILAGRGLISDVEYAAAIDFRDLWISNYGSPWPKAGTLEGGGGAGIMGVGPIPSRGQSQRLDWIIKRLEDYAWDRVVRLAVHEGDFDGIIRDVLERDITGKAVLTGTLGIMVAALRRTLGVIDSAPRFSK